MLLHTDYLSVSRVRAGAVFIPLTDLPQRTHELPPPYKEIQLIRDSRDSYYVLGWLHARGRRARLSDPPTHAPPNARYRLWQPNEWLEEFLTSPYSPVANSAKTSPLNSLSVNGDGEQHGRKADMPSHLFMEGEDRETKFLPPSLTPTALDLGCGSGREAVYLAELGWQVTAADRLPEALTRGYVLQARYAPDSPPIHWLCADLEKPEWQPEGKFDLITLFYFYSRELLERACAWLKPNGTLLVEAFTERHRAHYGKPASELRIARAGELPNLLPANMCIVHHSEDWRANGRHTARLWAENTTFEKTP